MSLAINVTTSSGLVLAADSRQSYRNMKGMARIGSDTASKLFQLSKRTGCAITGLAFLPSPEGIKNINAFVDEFKRIEEVERLNVEELTNRLHRFFESKYDWKTSLHNLKNLIKADLESKGLELIGDFEEEKGILKFKFKDKTGKEQQGIGGVDRIDVMVAGFNHDGSHQVFVCNVPGEVSKKRDSKEKGKEFGASWIGQIDVTSRIVLGWDGRMLILPFVQEAIKNLGEEEVVKQLRGLEYQISWGTMTLQDAIDFCSLAIRTTSAIQRFSDGIVMDPGDIPGVGGEIDIAVITRDKGFIWVKKKNIVIDGKEVDIDKIPNLE
jgi:20S proteasome alpha/beta subunit